MKITSFITASALFLIAARRPATTLPRPKLEPVISKGMAMAQHSVDHKASP
jgi:hypothetical protein